MGFTMYDQRCNNLYDRIKQLLVSYEWSDCCFKVCDKKFRAHKLILGISSPVFEAMFYGPLSTDDDITIVDIEPNIFQLLLNYIYTDNVDITSIEEAYDLLYVSRKYMLENLSDACKMYIQSNLNIDNVVTVLNYPDYIQDNELVASALKVACQHAEFLLKEKKNNISVSCMQKILQNDEINISEKDLILCVFQWTVSYCEQNNFPKDVDSRRDILVENSLLELLRFTTLSLTDFNEILSDNCNLLLQSDIDDIKQNLFKKEDCISEQLETINRNPIKIQWCLCHRTPIRSESPLIIEVQNNIVKCRVRSSKTVFVNSFSVQSRMAPGVNYYNNSATYPEEFTITILCEADNSIIKKIYYKKDVEYDSTIDIHFPERVLLKKLVWYEISFLWPKVSRFYTYSYAVQSRDRCYSNGKIQFDFEDFSSIVDTGSFLRSLRYCM
ncbi:kelch repeat and BTB domain-containing protein 12-like [Aricia agestis]|uniref:kelch repeat and BTB domain-containing protein 12-like n=1 Tax=Aricia agestis TaxID=91739 RepID=UPI001C20A01D|nr:kelch repeat and BTB domain-containing protein 12-like [Aricia agestis]